MASLPEFVLDRCPYSAFAIGESGRLLFVNRAACRALLYRRAELQQLFLWDMDTRVSASDWPNRWALFAENQWLDIESEHQRRDGTMFPVEVSATFGEFTESDGTTIWLVVAFACDVSPKSAQTKRNVRRVLRQRAFRQLNDKERAIFELLDQQATEKEIIEKLKISRSTYYRAKRQVTIKLGIEGSDLSGFWW